MKVRNFPNNPQSNGMNAGTALYSGQAHSPIPLPAAEVDRLMDDPRIRAAMTMLVDWLLDKSDEGRDQK